MTKILIKVNGKFKVNMLTGDVSTYANFGMAFATAYILI